QMSAWYVMSAMGFYEVTPGYPYYTIGSPIFDTVKIHLENQKVFTITSENNSDKNIYVSSMKVNGTNSDSILLSHTKIMIGGTLNFTMSSSQNKNLKPLIDFGPSKEISKWSMPVDP